MKHLPEPSRAPHLTIHFHLICGLVLILSALLLACDGEAVEQNGSGQGARPAEATAEAEEGDPTATRAASTGAAASATQSGSAPTPEAAGSSASSTQTAARAESTPPPTETPTALLGPRGDPAPVTLRPQAQGSPETDREALVALFNATDGESWDDSGIWSGPAPISQWPGVSDRR